MCETGNPINSRIDDEKMGENAFVNGRNKDIVPGYPDLLSQNPIVNIEKYQLLETLSKKNDA